MHIVIDNKTNSIILETSEDGQEDTNKKPGTPGTPGSRDLETALRRLSLRRENYLSERLFFEEDRERKLRELAEKEDIHSGSATPTESIMSLGTHSGISEFTGFSGMSIGSRSYLPEKLQIVKPLEGSVTLHQWQQLAQPNLGGILDPRPGVVTKGFRPLELDLDEVYRLSDYEEDETDSISFQDLPSSTSSQHLVTSVHFPGKCMSHTSSTFTFTTCRILHPSDELTRVTPSLSSAPSTTCSANMSNFKITPAATPCTSRRLSLAESFTNIRESTTTMSTSLGLARLLKENGISAAVYNPLSWNRTGASTNTILDQLAPRTTIMPSTPPNSPMQTPSSSPPSFEYTCTSPPYDNFLASKPASSILKDVRGEKKGMHSSECQTDVSVSNLNLVDKVKRIGIARVVGPGTAVSQAAPLTDDQRFFLGGSQRPVRPFVPGGFVPESVPVGCPTVVTNSITGIQLNSGIRRNRSFPTMVGSSMQMKAPSSINSGILMGPLASGW